VSTPPRMPRGTRPFTFEHDYVSTACQHRQHTDCRRICKYCPALCLCVCHRWAVPVENG
jgi:hypothetical protein